MTKTAIGILAATGAMFALSACTHTGGAVPTWDNPLDVRNCRKVQEVSPSTSTAGGFGAAVAAMRLSTIASGGTDLLLQRDRHDWSATTGVAYDCRTGHETTRHLSHKVVKD